MFETRIYAVGTSSETGDGYERLMHLSVCVPFVAREIQRNSAIERSDLERKWLESKGEQYERPSGRITVAECFDFGRMPHTRELSQAVKEVEAKHGVTCVDIDRSLARSK